MRLLNMRRVQEADRLLRQAVDLWVNPEIADRRNRGLITDTFTLYAAQVIFPSPQDARPNYVRLNDEIQVRFKVRVNTPVPRDDIRESEIEGLEAARLL